MKHNRIQRIILVCAFILISSSTEAQIFMQRKLRNLPGVVSVEKLQRGAHFRSKYLVMFEQPVDHDDTSAGTFSQRVFVFHKSFTRPVVFTAEGYSAEYAEQRRYTDEISSIFRTNQIVVEHRYFGRSVPDSLDWDRLTVENAATDHHKVIQSFKTLYPGRWLSTGISKGGTTAMIHKVLYPDDAVITVPYVAPLNFGLADGRHEVFVYTNALPEYRNAINAFQTQVLLRRDSIMPRLKQYVEGNKLTFKIGLDELYDYLVLEYAFSFYQWGLDVNTIPWDGGTYDQFFNHLVTVAPPEYFAVESYDEYLPFFVQAARQLGYYGYEIKPFWDLMTITTTEGYLQRIFLPDSIQYTFDPSISYRIQNYIETEDPKMIFIYGEWDPWSASAVVFDWREKKNMLKIVKPRGSHLTRISNLPESQRKQVLDLLEKWLYQ